MRVKVLTPELLEELKSGNRSNKKQLPKILTSEYVSQLNRGMAYRIQECERVHSSSVEIAKHSIFD